MKIAVDKDIVGAREIFAQLGEVQLFDGWNPERERLSPCDALVVRSVTKVDEALLAGTKIRFVGTATAGVDHIDQNFLAAQDIAFTDAVGANANAVAEFVVASLFARKGERARELCVGIVGYGHVGQALAGKLDSLGIAYIVNDPPRASSHQDVEYRALTEILGCDVVTIHVPLVTDGDHPTRYLVDARALAQTNAECMIFNTSRGGVIDEHALKESIGAGNRCEAIIDCWEREPAIDHAMLSVAAQATPHIAGHSIEARGNAALQIAEVFASWASIRTPSLAIQAPDRKSLPGGSLADVLRAAAQLDYSEQCLREHYGSISAPDRDEFIAARKDCGLRVEFAAYDIASTDSSPDTVAALERLGFKIR